MEKNVLNWVYSYQSTWIHSVLTTPLRRTTIFFVSYDSSVININIKILDSSENTKNDKVSIVQSL